jgi:hypothetical protein
MIPGSARNWIAVNAVQQSNLNKKIKTKNMTTLPLRKSIGRSPLRRGFLSTALLSALLGVMALPSAWANGNPSASGHANLTINGGLQTYSFNAIQNRNGSVSGHLTLDSRGQNINFQGNVTCLVINGNEAIIGGIITHITPNSDPSFFFLVGQPFVLRVVDNGEGAPDPVDLVSDVNAPADCSVGSFLGLVPIEAGNINVNP